MASALCNFAQERQPCWHTLAEPRGGAPHTTQCMKIHLSLPKDMYGMTEPGSVRSILGFSDLRPCLCPCFHATNATCKIHMHGNTCAPAHAKCTACGTFNACYLDNICSDYGTFGCTTQLHHHARLHDTACLWENQCLHSFCKRPCTRGIHFFSPAAIRWPHRQLMTCITAPMGLEVNPLPCRLTCLPPCKHGWQHACKVLPPLLWILQVMLRYGAV
mmetsp:Transcript_38843/g.86398  ORF Transcript_38843/g.86398 Transcript_38843/m.86398 type:complete len:217 (-) Transcript_38843:92-742(-)